VRLHATTQRVADAADAGAPEALAYIRTGRQRLGRPRLAGRLCTRERTPSSALKPAQSIGAARDERSMPFRVSSRRTAVPVTSYTHRLPILRPRPTRHGATPRSIAVCEV
jgi:hypothetical protein